MTNKEVLNALNDVLECIILVEEEAEEDRQKIEEIKLSHLKILDFIADALIEQIEINGILQLCLTGK